MLEIFFVLETSYQLAKRPTHQAFPLASDQILYLWLKIREGTWLEFGGHIIGQIQIFKF